MINEETAILHCICCDCEILPDEQWEYATDFERELFIVGIIVLLNDVMCENCAEEIDKY